MLILSLSFIAKQPKFENKILCHNYDNLLINDPKLGNAIVIDWYFVQLIYELNIFLKRKYDEIKINFSVRQLGGNDFFFLYNS